MNLRNPLNSLSFALLHAIEFGLDGVPSEEATAMIGPAADGGPRRRRPIKDECDVLLFSQSWTSDDVGLHDAQGLPLHGETVVVIGPEGDACVYFASQLIHHIRHPNRRYLLDAVERALEGVCQSDRTERTQASSSSRPDVTLSLPMSPPPVRPAGQPVRAALIAAQLSAYASKFAGIAARDAGQTTPATVAVSR